MNYRPRHCEAEHCVKGERHCSFHLKVNHVAAVRPHPLRVPLAQFQLLQWPTRSALIGFRNIPS